MLLEPLQCLLGALSGGVVGFTLGLFGGGGSILAVPLMVYVVGVPGAHVAIGTSAFAVAANAATNLVTHARKGQRDLALCSDVHGGRHRGSLRGFNPGQGHGW